jgi:hypothetical protein
MAGVVVLQAQHVANMSNGQLFARLHPMYCAAFPFSFVRRCWNWTSRCCWRWHATCKGLLTQQQTQHLPTTTRYCSWTVQQSSCRTLEL